MKSHIDDSIPIAAAASLSLSVSVSRTILRESNCCDSQDKARNRQGTCAGSEVLYQFYEEEILYKYCNQRQKTKQKRQPTNQQTNKQN
jgi:hypothetical protein